MSVPAGAVFGHYRRTKWVDLAAVDEAFTNALDVSRVVAAVEARLIAAGGVTELRQLHGMSAAETDLLVRREIDAPCVAARKRVA